MKKLNVILLFFIVINGYARKPVADTIEIKQFINLMNDCYIDIKGGLLFDTLNTTSYKSKVVIKGTSDNVIYIGKDSSYTNTYTPCSYSAIIADSLSESNAKLLTRIWKKELHTLLTDEQAILYSNDYGFDFEPLSISYSLQKDNLELMVSRIQDKDRKCWTVTLYLAKRY